MDAQSITPFKTAGVLRNESAARSLSDVFQYILREREAEFVPERDRPDLERPLSRSERRPESRDDLADDAARRTARDRERLTDATREVRDQRPDPAETRQPDPREAHNRPEDSGQHPRQRAERADQEAAPSVRETGSDDTDEPGQGGDVLADSEAAANLANAALNAASAPAAPAAQIVPAVSPTPPASEVTTLGARFIEPANLGPEAKGTATVTDPSANKPGAESLPRTSLSGTAGALGLAAPGPAEAAAAATLARPDTGAPGAAARPKPAAAPASPLVAERASADMSEGKVSLSKEDLAAIEARLRSARAGAPGANPVPGARPEQSGSKTVTPAQLRDLATPGQQGDPAQAGRANPNLAAAVLEAAGQRSQGAMSGAGDPAAPGAKFAATAATAGQAQAGLNGLDSMQGAVRAAATHQAFTPSAERPVPTHEVAVHIQRAAARGEDRIRVQLHPAELGQIDVRLKLGADGFVRAVIQVERPETLDLMQRDARGLERALQDAGLKTDSGSLSFNLRDNGHGGPRDHDGQTPTGAGDTAQSDSQPSIEAAEVPIQTGWSSRALDMRV